MSNDEIEKRVNEMFKEKMVWLNHKESLVNESGIYQIIPYKQWYKAFFKGNDLTPLNPILDLELAKDICETHMRNYTLAQIIRQYETYF